MKQRRDKLTATAAWHIPRTLIAVGVCALLVSPAQGEEPVYPLLIKSNILYDLALSPNLSVELPVGQHYSVALNYMTPWWVTRDDSWCTQIQEGTGEFRWWPKGNPRYRAEARNWYLGLEAGGGDYDLERRSKGYQGEYLRFGLSTAYIHPLGDGLSMEFGLGAGALLTKYRRYHGESNNRYLVWKYSGRSRWYGPLEARVTLVYSLPMKKGGAR